MKLKKLLEHDFIKRFQSVLVTPFEKELFVASLRNYCSHGNPIRFHNFAFSMRELVLQVIERRAPNEKVVKSVWYESESDKFEVTRRQKLKFCAQGYLSDAYFEEEDIEELDSNIKEFLKKFNFFNKYTHITAKHFSPCPKTFYSDMKYIVQLSQDVIEELSALESYVVEKVEGHLQEKIFHSVINNFPDDLSILASNVIIEEIHPEEVKVIGIGESKVSMRVFGTVYVSQEYGKGEDFVAMSNNYPFSVRLYISVSDPKAISVDTCSIEVDTSSWYE